MTRFKMRLLCTAVAVAALTQLGCGRAETDPSEPGSARQAIHSDTLPELHPFISQWLEIDLADPSDLAPSAPPGDANLFVGKDPADLSASKQKPANASATFIDWGELAILKDLKDHQLVDLNDTTTGSDLSSFPGSNECVGASNVLSKMDLTYVAAANNTTWAYFAVQRANNNGDAGYYWLFTRARPIQVHEAPCAATQYRLKYQLSAGDVLLAGHFQPGKTALLTIYKANASVPSTPVTAVQAINFQAPYWTVSADAVAAVNTTMTAPDSLGTGGVLAVVSGLQGPALGPEIFAEAAVPVSLFTSNPCGEEAKFYGSVITRSSGSGGTSPDLKDLAGPAFFNFGRPKATAKVTTFCAPEIMYEAAPELPGQSISNAICEWQFIKKDDGTVTVPTPSLCTSAAPLTLAPGDYTASVTVKDKDVPSCVSTPSTSAFTVYAKLAVDPVLTGSCSGTFLFEARNPSGGSGTFSYVWSFPPGVVPVAPSTPNSPSGTATVPAGGVDYEGTVVITDIGRSDSLVCTTDKKSDSDRVYFPIGITLALQSKEPACGIDADKAVYTASPSGGSGAYALNWTTLACGLSTDQPTWCTINPSDDLFCTTENFQVIAADTNADALAKGCQPATSAQTAHYEKITTVNASVQ
jgi:hypothetical protein